MPRPEYESTISRRRFLRGAAVVPPLLVLAACGRFGRPPFEQPGQTPAAVDGTGAAATDATSIPAADGAAPGITDGTAQAIPDGASPGEAPTAIAEAPASDAVVCEPGTVPPSHETIPVPKDFVHVVHTENGPELAVNGVPTKFVATNRWNLMTEDGSGCGNKFSEEALRAFVKSEKASGVRVVRFWAFDDYLKNGPERLDLILSILKEEGMYAIPTLVNQWSACDESYDDSRFTYIGDNGKPRKSSEWFRTGHTVPNGSAPGSFDDHLDTLVQRYSENGEKNDLSSAIFCWQIGNEMESARLATAEEIDKGSEKLIDDPDPLLAFTNATAERIKNIDRRHLVAPGFIGGGQFGTKGPAFRELHKSPHIDIVGFHDYQPGIDPSQQVTVDENCEPINLSDGILRCIEYARQLGKVPMVDEIGWDLNDPNHNPDPGRPATPEWRAEIMDLKYQAYFKIGVGLVGYWSAPDVGVIHSEGYEYGPDDPFRPKLRQAAEIYSAPLLQPSN